MLDVHPVAVPGTKHASTEHLRLLYKVERQGSFRERFAYQSENVVHCIICHRCTCIYIGETSRRLRRRVSGNYAVFAINLLSSATAITSAACSRSFIQLSFILYHLSVTHSNNIYFLHLSLSVSRKESPFFNLWQ